MSINNKYYAINKALWNDRTLHHFDSEFYDNKSFLEHQNSLTDIELPLLGDLSGKSVLHLQCHFGQDTISFEKLGAAKAVGVDLSDTAVEKANELAKMTNSKATFICCNIYDLPQHLNEKFDLVFTSYGTIAWLPDLQAWAKLIDHFLKPGGKFVFAEFHPVVWMFDDSFKEIKYRYFNSGPIIEKEEGTYGSKEAIINKEFVCWNHSIGETLQSLINVGLQIQHFSEYDYSPYDCFENTVEIAPRKYRIEPLGDKIPMVYALVAQK